MYSKPKKQEVYFSLLTQYYVNRKTVFSMIRDPKTNKE